MAAAPDTAELLKEILLELRTLNQNLGQVHGQRLDGKDACLDNEDAIPQSGASFEAGAGRAVESIAEDGHGVKDVGDMGAPKALMESSLGDEETSKLDGDHLLVDGAKSGKDVPITEPSQAWKSRNRSSRRSKSGRRSRRNRSDKRSRHRATYVEEDDTGDDYSNAEEITFRYDSNIPYYGPADGEQYPTPSEEKKALWSQYLGRNWAIPMDGRVALTLHSSYLISKSEEEATDVLRTVRDYARNLGSTGRAFSLFTIRDYLPYDERKYFGADLDEDRHDLPQDSITVRWNVDKYPSGPRLGVPLGAPWRRIIEIRGLGSNIASNSPRETIYKAAFPWLDTDNVIDGNIFQAYLISHLLCLPFPLERQAKSTVFHITFHEILGPTNRSDITEKKWKAGPLHSDRQQYWDFEEVVSFRDYDHEPDALDHKQWQKSALRYLRESAFTIYGVLGRSQPPQFWTIMILMPETWGSSRSSGFLYNEHSEYLRMGRSILVVMAMLVRRSITEMCDNALANLLRYFQNLVSEKSALLDPNYHDGLLSDDDNFSRSKAYFWAINTLREIEGSILENVKQIECCADCWPSQWSSENEIPWQTNYVKTQLEPSITRLLTIKENFKAIRIEATALRDGLFSASSVMESRASTRLGENVKLLTYVSIFFLPLSFCMSVWSINNTLFSLSALAITATLIALATYIIVFNLNHITRGVASTYTFCTTSVAGAFKEAAKTDPKDSAGQRQKETSGPIESKRGAKSSGVLKSLQFWTKGKAGVDVEVRGIEV